MIKTTLIGYGQLQTKNLITYIERLDAHLDSYYPNILWNVLCQNGTTVKTLLDNLEDKVLVHHPNIVFINLSSAEMKQDSQSYISISTYKEVLNALLAKIHKHNNRTGLNGCRPIPIVITPPPILPELAEEKFNNKILLEYRNAIEEIVLEWNGVLLDLFTHLNKKRSYKEYMNGLGLNQNGQDLLYDLVFLEMTKLINYQGVLKDRDEVYEDEE